MARMKSAGIGNLGMVTNPPEAPPDETLKDRASRAISMVTSILINALFFVGIAAAGLTAEMRRAARAHHGRNG